jgi:phosphoglycerate dehydrogenase-like enzyme
MKTLVAIVNEDLKTMFFEGKALEALASFSEYVMYEDTGAAFSSEGLSEVIGDYDACITSWGSPFFTGQVLERTEKLKFIGHTAGSATAVVDEAAYDKGITVVTANIELAKATAEAAVALIMAGAWDLLGYSQRFKRGEWSNNNRDTVMGIGHQTIGLIGYGEISRNVINYLKGFPVTIKLASRYCSEEEAAELGVTLCPLEELLQTCQIISLHSSLTQSTVGMIGRKELALIQDGALFVNTARGKIVDEQALIEELQAGRFFAAIDVYHREPVPADHPLLQLENALCLPHIGGFATKYKRGMSDFVVENLRSFSKGNRPIGSVSREEYRRMTSSTI